MPKLLGLKLFFTYFMTSLLVICPAFGQSGGGASGNGEMNKCTGNLEDLEIAAWGDHLRPKEEPIYKNAILPKLNEIGKSLPDLAKAMQLALDKPWNYAVPSEDFKDCNPEYWFFLESQGGNGTRTDHKRKWPVRQIRKSS